MARNDCKLTIFGSDRYMSPAFLQQLAEMRGEEYKESGDPERELCDLVVSQVLTPFGAVLQDAGTDHARITLHPRQYSRVGKVLTTCFVTDRGKQLFCSFVAADALPYGAALVIKTNRFGGWAIEELHFNDVYATTVE